MEQINEELLSAWLKLSSSVRNDRVVMNMSYNEMHICNLISKAQIHGSGHLTATDLCRETGLLKSQMNKVLTGLEEKGTVTRCRSRDDKRRIFIRMSEEGNRAYEQEHQRILDFVDELILKIGPADTEVTINLMNTIANCVTDILT